MLPGQDGWDLLQILLNRPETNHIPLIICTVLKQKELALSLGATAFLEKPVTEQALFSTLEALGEA
jgi:CheY-like chemotaxis protein